MTENERNAKNYAIDVKLRELVLREAKEKMATDGAKAAADLEIARQKMIIAEAEYQNTCDKLKMEVEKQTLLVERESTYRDWAQAQGPYGGDT